MVSGQTSQVSGAFDGALSTAAKLDRIGMAFLRFGLIVVLFWIGGLKFADYEANSIVPFVANSPLMNFFYRHGDQYRSHITKRVSSLLTTGSGIVITRRIRFRVALGP